jgi:hypothetical protein
MGFKFRAFQQNEKNSLLKTFFFAKKRDSNVLTLKEFKKNQFQKTFLNQNQMKT